MFDFVANSIILIGDVSDDYPLQKNRIGFEKLREIPHLRPRTNTFEAIFKIRSALSIAIHRFFQIALAPKMRTSEKCGKIRPTQKEAAKDGTQE